MQSKLFTTKKKNVKINLYVFLINYSNTVADVNLKFLRGIKDICSFTACHHSILITSQQIFQFLHHSPESAEQGRTFCISFLSYTVLEDKRHFSVNIRHHYATITLLNMPTPVLMHCYKQSHVSSTTNNCHNKPLSEQQCPVKHLNMRNCLVCQITIHHPTNHHSQSHQICRFLLYQNTFHLGNTRIMPFLWI